MGCRSSKLDQKMGKKDGGTGTGTIDLKPYKGAKRRSLLIGINYIGQQGELRGCINDVERMKKYIGEKGFQSGSGQKVLIEQAGYETPTKQHILDGFFWLLEGCSSGDHLFLHYSGHGGQQKDRNGDESDGKDETLVPLDYQTAGMITDDEVYEHLVAHLPKGALLTVVMDCCHSGTIMDLPYTFLANGSGGTSMKTNTSWLSKAIVVLGKVFPPAAAIGANFAMANEFVTKSAKIPGMGGDTVKAIQTANPPIGDKLKSQMDNLGTVIMFSGCKDEQTSADVSGVGQFQLPPDSGPGGAGGALTSGLLEILAKSPGNFDDGLTKLRSNLQSRKFTQVPQVSSTRNFDITKQSFFLVAPQ